MNVSITIGTWICPLIISMASAAWLVWPRRNEGPTGGMFGGSDFFGLIFRLPVFLIVALGAWLAWALIK